MLKTIEGLFGLGWQVGAGLVKGRRGRRFVILLASALVVYSAYAFGYPAFFRW